MGTLVSRAFIVIGGVEADPIRHTLAVIDSLHGDGKIPSLIAKRQVLKELAGQFVAGQEVLIHPQTPIAEFVTAHELGHVLDFYGFTTGRNESLQGYEMMPIFDAWFASNAYRELQTLNTRFSESLTDPGEERIRQKQWDKVKYLLSREEFWSRAYAQWVAISSLDPILLQQLETLRQDPVYSRFFLQWSDDDFARIDREIYLLFKRKGWLR